MIAVAAEPTGLTSALTTAGPVQAVSGKLFDGLVSHDRSFNPQPQLATSWTTSSDGLAITFKLRPGVTWHDGQPFTSADVAYSVLEIWKKFHSRGRSTFANVIAAETPDPLTVVLRLSKPAPYLISALSSVESQVLPKHLYDGTDVLTNPHNNRPVGTGPFRFLGWERGSYIVFERNPNYWDQPKPYLDRIVFRILPDSVSRVNAVETGEVHLSNVLPQNEIARLAKLPQLQISRDPNFNGVLSSFDFNLDKPHFQDVRVRQAFAHAIDRDFIRQAIWYDFAKVEDSPIPAILESFHSKDVPLYPYDLDKAAALLDAAGYKPDADGVRLAITHDPLPNGEPFVRTGEYLRDALGKIGVKVTLRTQDFASFVRRIYTDRDFDTFHFAATSGPDPAIGTQRFYWSQNYQPGVAFSNGSHYANPEVDRLLEAAQIENDPEKRRDFYASFQRIVQTDLPKIPLLSLDVVNVANRLVRQFETTAYGLYDNSAETYIAHA